MSLVLQVIGYKLKYWIIHFIVIETFDKKNNTSTTGRRYRSSQEGLRNCREDLEIQRGLEGAHNGTCDEFNDHCFCVEFTSLLSHSSNTFHQQMTEEETQTEGTKKTMNHKKRIQFVKALMWSLKNDCS